MEPVTFILAALAAGVSTGVSDAAAQSIKDGYSRLKALVMDRFASDPKALETLSDYEADPDTYERPLAKQLSEMNVDKDDAVREAAEELLRQADVAGVTTKYSVTVRGGKVGIIGDNGHIDTMN